MAMLTHHIQNVLRHIRQQKATSVINILGLSLGLGITLVIWIFVIHELSYDKFITDHDRIYRIQSTASMGSGSAQKLPTAMFPLGEILIREYPEVEEVVRFSSYYHSPEVVFEEEGTTLSGIMFGEPGFFNVFDFELLAGDPDNVLEDPSSIVINETNAARLTGDPLDAIDRMITIQDRTYRISGIMQDLPENTHMAFNAFSHFDNLPEQAKEAGMNFFTYIKVLPGTDVGELEEKLNASVAEIIESNPAYDGMQYQVGQELIRLGDIHLHSDLVWEMKDNGKMRNVIIFALLSFFILFLAIINYINLATARSMLRSKEIGIRKVSGATKGGLVRQIMTESFITIAMAFVAAFVMSELFARFFSQQLGVHLGITTLFSWQGLLALLLILTVTCFLSGLYPAFYLAAFDPVKTLKGEMVKGNKGSAFRRVLVVFQFAITIFVASSLIVMISQLRHMQRSDLGFDTEEVIILRNLSGGIWQSFPAATARLEAIPGVETAGGGNFLYGGGNRIDLITESGMDPESGVMADIITVDHGFLDAMGIELLEGRNFYEGSEMDVQSAFILNETAVNALGFDEPIGKQLDLFGMQGPLIGVVKDFHMKSLHQPIDPLVMNYAQVGFPHIYLKALPGDYEPLRIAITKALQEFDPSYIPDMVFLDENIELLYQQEQRTASLLSAGTFLAFIISLLGVYGLAAFAAERKIKETGIRIVLGAGLSDLLWNFNRESVILSGIALIIAAPLAWYAMNQWLDNFAVRVDLNVFWFLIPGLVILLISSLIISIQATYSIRANPVESLKYE